LINWSIVILWINFSRSLSYPPHEAIEEWSVLLLDGVYILLSSDIVVVAEVLVKMGFELLVADESLATVRTLELNSLIQFSNGNNVESILIK